MWLAARHCVRVGACHVTSGCTPSCPSILEDGSMIYYRSDSNRRRSVTESRTVRPSADRGVYAPDCPTRQVLDRVANKWTVLIIGILNAGPHRYFSSFSCAAAEHVPGHGSPRT